MKHIHDDTFPFRTTLSLSGLFAFWQTVGRDEATPRAAVARQIEEQLDAHPDLTEPIVDPAILEAHRDLLDLMMVAIFPAALWEEVIMAVMPPFQMQPFYTSPTFDRLQIFGKGCPTYLEKSDFNEQSFGVARAMYAYYWILGELYQFNLPTDHPLIFGLPNDETGLDQYFKIDMNTQFATIETRGPLPKLSEAQIEHLLSEPLNLPLWMDALPPEHFEFQGFVVLTATEVTRQEVLSALKDDLLQKDAMATPERVDHLQHRLRSLLRVPDLDLGLICLQSDDIEGIIGSKAIGRSLLLGEQGAPACPYKADSFYAHTYNRREPLLVSDLSGCEVCTGFEMSLKGQGYRTLLLAPLRFEDKLIGILELASPRPNAINGLTATKMGEAISLFATAMKRSLDEQEERVQAVIKENYTAIHRTVEWRFREVTQRYLEAQSVNPMAQIQEVVFRDVYPIYGLSDIRHSSSTRNTAIQEDLKKQLDLAYDVIVEASIHAWRPILDEISDRIRRYHDRIEQGASTDDESSALEFLKRDVEPLFDQIEVYDERVREKIAVYQSALDPEHGGALYDQRRRFEESVTRINETIAALLKEKETEAQDRFPHYFELFKTDGVDYNIYVGASLLENGSFSVGGKTIKVTDENIRRFYLRDMRLWQLMTMCRVEWTLRDLKPTLQMPLDATHLILVQNVPLSIRFRMEEKQFDVDGAYNIRYEIVKKRIDKAVILGTGERLTQPGQIAIVYSQARELAEYQRYLEYLTAAGYITGEVEEYDLEPMQGVYGLKALRVTVSETPPEATVEVEPARALAVAGDSSTGVSEANVVAEVTLEKRES